MDTKDKLLASSEEKLAYVQEQLKHSVGGLDAQTLSTRNKDIADITTRNEELEREICCLRCTNEELLQSLAEKEKSLRTLQDVLVDHEPLLEAFDIAQNQQPVESDAVATMQRELDAAREENRKLQQTVVKMSSSTTGDAHLQDLLCQSKCAVERIALELSKQYEDWDSMKKKLMRSTDARDNILQTDTPNATKATTANEMQEKTVVASMSDEITKTHLHKNVSCTCLKHLDNSSTSTDPYICDCKKNIVESRNAKEKLQSDQIARIDKSCICLESPRQKDEDDDEMYSARSQDLEGKVAFLEQELSQANDTIMDLQNRLANNERTAAENAALRRHSSEVQDIAKEQIEELVEHLKKSKSQITQLEDEKSKLNGLLNGLYQEREKLMELIKQLQQKGEGEELETCRARIRKLEMTRNCEFRCFGLTLEREKQLRIEAEEKLAALESKYKELSSLAEEGDEEALLAALKKKLEDQEILLVDERKLKQEALDKIKLLEDRILDLENILKNSDNATILSQLDELKSKLRDKEEQLLNETKLKLEAEQKLKTFWVLEITANYWQSLKH